MIAYLEGEIIFRAPNFVILKAGGVGYRIHLIPGTELAEDFAALYTHLAVREDAFTL
jgi:holliday junction DNA helicase RuvA